MDKNYMNIQNTNKNDKNTRKRNKNGALANSWNKKFKFKYLKLLKLIQINKNYINIKK